jgi:TatD DNase family protein
VVSQCQKEASLYGVVGISAFDVEQLADGWESDLNKLLSNDKIIGIGEIGIDNTNPRYPPFEKQLAIFDQQLAIARDLDIPVVIHSRGAEQQAIDMCRNQQVVKAVFHCFTGGKNALRNLLDAGYYVSYSGIVTFKDTPLVKQVAYTPLDQLFIETDSPYLAPEPYRGKQNEPAYISFIGERVAEIKKTAADEVAERIRSNFSTLFNVSISDT